MNTHAIYLNVYSSVTAIHPPLTQQHTTTHTQTQTTRVPSPGRTRSSACNAFIARVASSFRLRCCCLFHQNDVAPPSPDDCDQKPTSVQLHSRTLLVLLCSVDDKYPTIDKQSIHTHKHTAWHSSICTIARDIQSSKGDFLFAFEEFKDR